MKTVKVSGANKKHKVLLYALSTCAWCKKAKNLLKSGDVAYEYVDVDLCSRECREEIRRNIMDRGGRLTYPSIIIDDEVLISGFQEERIRKALEI